MSIKEIVSGGGLLLIALTLIQIAPVKLDPWSGIGKLLKKTGRAIGRTINADVLKELSEVKSELSEVQTKIDSHVTMDDRRTADGHRTRILHFNNELLRDIKHTKEEFIEVLAEIDAYEDYCSAHPEYPNNRAVLAIKNIRDNYSERLKEHDFLQEGSAAAKEDQT